MLFFFFLVFPFPLGVPRCPLYFHFSFSYQCSCHIMYTLAHPLARDFRQRKPKFETAVYDAIVVGPWSVFGFHFHCLCMPSSVRIIIFPCFIIVCVFFTLKHSFYPSTSSTPSVRADYSSYIERHKLCGSKTTTQIQIYYIVM